MIRIPTRATSRFAQSSLAPARTTSGRRFLSTAPPHLRRRSWKSFAARWGIAAGGVYFYTTSPIFAEQPQNNLLNPNLDVLEEETSGTSLEALTSRPRRPLHDTSILESVVQSTSEENASTSESRLSASTEQKTESTSPADLEAEADQQGAFNPETGEINWDCPCLGGMAHGPCGPEFRNAFSCFVYSTEEPKGMECIDKFQGMQTCFQAHPEVYKGELLDDEEDEEGGLELDEGMKAEREELVREIKERREKMGSEGEGAGERRLLEEPASASAVKKDARPRSYSKAKPAESTKTEAKDSENTEEPEAAKKVEGGMPAKKEPIKEGQSSQVVKQPQPPPVKESKVFDKDLELMPKAWHDASDDKETGPEKKKS